LNAPYKYVVHIDVNQASKGFATHRLSENTTPVQFSQRCKPPLRSQNKFVLLLFKILEKEGPQLN